MSDPTLHRRRIFLKAAAAAGAGSAVFSRALAALAEKAPAVTPEMIREAEWIAGIALTEEERALMAKGVDQNREAFAACRAVPLDNAVSPAFRFDPETSATDRASDRGAGTREWRPAEGLDRPESDVELAFAGVAKLAGLLKARKVSSVELTRLHLDRIERHDPALRAVITRTDALALQQAESADREIAAGRWRGPLHGIPWGAKDLLAVPGYPTTWGSVPYKEQTRTEVATVVSKLDAAGAVLVAKTAVGELAWGDVWFDATTKNPWKTDQGSSGSSAGSASGTSAALFPFAIGTETLGSIVSPCTRCGVSGLRPTFGRVSRHGAMALSWTMDKVGPIARSVGDLALVFAAIHGADGHDRTAVSRPFSWPYAGDPRKFRVGYVPEHFEFDYTKWADEDEDPKTYAEWQSNDKKVLSDLKSLGFSLVPIELPKDIPVGALSPILTAEAAAAFDELTRSGKDDLLVRQVEQAWPNVFRQGQLIPAVEYIRANRIRTLLMRAMDESMRDVDVYVVPTYGGNNLLATNLTGHPAVCVPDGFRESDGTPTSITFQGRLHEDDKVLAMAQSATSPGSGRPADVSARNTPWTPRTTVANTEDARTVLLNVPPREPAPTNRRSFTRRSSETATNGSNRPLSAWARRITGIGFTPATPNAVPKRRTPSHTPRNRNERSDQSEAPSSRTPRAAMAAARGAVMDDVNPAAKRPTAKSHGPAAPKRDSMARPIASKEIAPMTAVPATTMAAETTPPRTMATPSPNRASPNVRPRARPDPRKRLYGTTVVPTSPRTSSDAPSGTEGTANPRTISPSDGATSTAATTNATPITPTIAPRTRATVGVRAVHRSRVAAVAIVAARAGAGIGMRSAAPAAAPRMFPAW